MTPKTQTEILIAPSATTDVHDKLSSAIDALKARLAARYALLFPAHSSLVHSALEVAEAVAWCTPFPHLFLPELAEQQIARCVPGAATFAPAR